MCVRICLAVTAAIAAMFAFQNPAFIWAQDSGYVALAADIQDVQEDGESDAADDDDLGLDDELDLDFLDQDLSEIRSTQVTEGAMSTEIESVSRTAQPLAKTPAAVYVVTNEMIQRSGARNIPEVLRMVPGLQVARIDANTWAISIRGFNSQYANKLLVQIDGRAAYTPTFSGVLWDQQRLLLKDVERIEIIRGPGGTVWGANAVNGIISITTKNSADTQGLYGEIGGGSEHQLFSGLRAGGAVNEELTFRLWGTQALDDSGHLEGRTPEDGFSAGQGGFRADWTPTNWDMVTVQGDFLGGDSGLLSNTTGVRTANTLLRWSHEIDEDMDWSFQTYWDRFTRDSAGSFLRQNIFDFDYQFHARIGRSHDVVVGAGFRNASTTMEFLPTSAIRFQPSGDTFDIISYFLQDTIELVDDRLYATLGCKFEHNDFVGFQYQPTLKVAWIPDEQTSIWGSVGRAVRTPAISDRDLLYSSTIAPGPPFPTTLRAFGNRGVGPEDVIAYEVGIRRQPTEELFWDLAVFFNRYNNLMAMAPNGMVMPPPAIFVDYLNAGVGDADTYGFEWAATYDVSESWKVRGSYSFFVEQVAIPDNMLSLVSTSGLTPRNQVYLSSGWNLGDRTTLDAALRYTDSLAAGVPRYLVADVRVARRFGEGLEVSVVGQNLFDSQHPEFDYSGTIRPTEVEAGVYGMVSYEY